MSGDAVCKLAIPPLYADVTMDRLDGKNLAWAENIAQTRSDALLMGIQGNGKTTMATAILKRVVELRPGTTARWELVPNVLAEMQSKFGRAGAAPEDYMAGMIRYDVLLLDDLGAEQATDWKISELSRLVTNRINHKRMTIVTTNLVGEELKAWNSRVYSRLRAFRRIIPGDKDRRGEA